MASCLSATLKLETIIGYLRLIIITLFVFVKLLDCHNYLIVDKKIKDL